MPFRVVLFRPNFYLMHSHIGLFIGGLRLGQSVFTTMLLAIMVTGVQLVLQSLDLCTKCSGWSACYLTTFYDYFKTFRQLRGCSSVPVL